MSGDAEYIALGFIAFLALIWAVKFVTDVLDESAARRAAAEKAEQAEIEKAAERYREAIRRSYEWDKGEFMRQYEAMRNQSTHEYAQHQARMNAQFYGFQPPPVQPRPQSQWRLVLGITDPTPTREDISRAYRSKAKTAHPDHGGTTEAMAKLNAAKKQALLETPA